VKAFLDTSVLVATFYADHQHHERSLSLFLRQKTGGGCTAAHCLAEVYSVLTGMPGKDKASPPEALLFLTEVRAKLSLSVLDADGYTAVVQAAAEQGISGGAVHDAVIAACALKAKADII
jgi:predicted nucleic acid-binding protein